MVIQYSRVWYALGKNTHKVCVYKEYSEANGLLELVTERESTRISEVIKGIEMTKQQKDLVKSLARERTDGIALENGSYRQY